MRKYFHQIVNPFIPIFMIYLPFVLEIFLYDRLPTAPCINKAVIYYLFHFIHQKLSLNLKWFLQIRYLRIHTFTKFDKCRRDVTLYIITIFLNNVSIVITLSRNLIYLSVLLEILMTTIHIYVHSFVWAKAKFFNINVY